MSTSVLHCKFLNVFSTAYGSVTFPTVIWLCMLQPEPAIYLKLYSSESMSVMVTAIGCDNNWQITVRTVTQPMTFDLTVHIFSVHVYPVPKKIYFIQIRLNYKDAGTYNISIETAIQNDAETIEFSAGNRESVIHSPDVRYLCLSEEPWFWIKRND